MTFIKSYQHYMWSTKERVPMINKEFKPLLLKHIKENSVKKNIFIDTLNCVEDHILIKFGYDNW